MASTASGPNGSPTPSTRSTRLQEGASVSGKASAAAHASTGAEDRAQADHARAAKAGGTSSLGEKPASLLPITITVSKIRTTGGHPPIRNPTAAQDPAIQSEPCARSRSTAATIASPLRKSSPVPAEWSITPTHPSQHRPKQSPARVPSVSIIRRASSQPTATAASAAGQRTEADVARPPASKRLGTTLAPTRPGQSSGAHVDP